MMEISDLTGGRKGKEKLLEEKIIPLIKEYFFELGDKSISSEMSFSLSKNGKMRLHFINIDDGTLIIYSKGIPDKKLAEFRGEYEKISGVKNLEITKDYSESS